MKRFLASAFLLMSVSLANAQAPTPLCIPGTSPTSGQPTCVPVTGSNPLPISGSFSANLTGFLSNGSFATLTATGSTSASTALPVGITVNPTVRITNNGTTVVSCTMATGAATGLASNILVQSGSSVSRVVGAFDHIACIDQTGSVSNPVVIEGGSGLGNDSGGGGSGGGGGGAITIASGAVASGAYSSGSFASGSISSGAIASGAVSLGAYVTGSIASGAMVDFGTTSDTVCATDTGNCTFIALTKRNNTLVSGSATVIQPTASLLNATIVGTGTFATQASISQASFGTSNGVVNAANTYQAVAASQTATVLQTSTGATGDYLSHCTIYPTSTSPGVVTVFDNTNTAANSAVLFAGGATSTSNLTPIVVAVGAKSVNGAWKVTTGTTVSVVCVGKFS